MELLGQDFPTAAGGPGGAVLLGSLDRADYLPPPAAAPAPTDVQHLSIGPPENAGYVYEVFLWLGFGCHPRALSAVTVIRGGF